MSRVVLAMAVLVALMGGGTVVSAPGPPGPAEAGDGAGGGLLRGNFGDNELVLRTGIGTVAVPTRLIERLEPGGAAQGVVVRLRNGDEIPGIPDREAIGFAVAERVVALPLVGEGGTSFIRRPDGQVIACRYPEAPVGALARDLVVHFTFDRTVGGRIPNETKRTAGAKLVGGRLEENVVSLDGHRDHLELSNHPSFEELDQFTVSLWVKVRGFGPGGYANEHGYLVNKGNDMWWNPAWCIGYSKRSGVGKGVNPGPLPALFTVGTEKSGGRATCRLSSRTQLETGRWYHLVGTYNGKEAMIYVDGRLENMVAYEGRIRRDKAPLLIGGGSLQGTGFRNHFTTNAWVDNLRVYSRALGPGEIRQLTKMEARGPADGP